MQDIDSWLPPLRAGRQPAGRALLSWLDDPQAPRLCRVTGAAGTGKSHLVAWFATACTSPRASKARGPVTALSLAGLSLDAAVWLLALRFQVAARTPAELVAELQADGRPRVLLVWDLDQSIEPSRIADELLDPLLELSHVRAVVEGTAVTTVPAPAVLDLDQPGWTDPARFARWCERLGAGSPFAADTVYPNPRLAQLAARVPAGTDTSAGVAAAWWSALPEEARPALGALAAVDFQLTLAEWSALADPGAVRQAAELLPADSHAGVTWRLPAGPLRDAVTAGTSVPSPWGIYRTVWATNPDSDFPDLKLRIALRAGQTHSPIDGADHLAQADPVVVTAAFAIWPTARFADLWRAAGPGLIAEPEASTRAAVLRAHLLGRDAASAARLTDTGRAAWQAQWSSAVETPLVAAALTQGPYTGYVMLADAAGVVRAASLADGQIIDVPANPAPAQLRSLTALPDGTVLALDAHGRPQLLAGAALPALPGAFEAELSVLGPAGAVGDTAGRVQWLPTGAAESLHTGPVTALGGAVLADNQVPTLVSGGLDGCVRVWLPGAPPLEKPVDQRDCAVVSVSVHQGPQGLLAATGWADGLVRIYLLDRAGKAVDVRLGSPVLSVLVDAGGRVVVVLPEGVVCLTVDPDARESFDLSAAPGGYYSTVPPTDRLRAVPGRAQKPVSDTVRAEAWLRPGQWLYTVDLDHPERTVTGCWQIDHQGAVVRYLANSEYVPKRHSAEEAVRLWVAGKFNVRELARIVADAELHVCTTAPDGTDLFVRPGADDDAVVDACTSAELVPRHWPGTVVLTGRELPAALPDGLVALNPGSQASVSLPIRVLT